MQGDGVMRLSDQSVIAHMAINDEDAKIRMQALRKLKDQSAIAHIAKNETKANIRSHAVYKLKDQAVLAYVAVNDEDAKIRMQALKKLKDQSVIANIAMNEKKTKNRMQALNQLKDQTVIAHVAMNDTENNLRKRALYKLKNRSFFTGKPKVEKTAKIRNVKPDPIIVESERFINELFSQRSRISHPGISGKIGLLVEIMQKIINNIKDDPDSIPKIKNFVNYYVPTTIKILNDFDDLSKMRSGGENTSDTIKRIENILDALYLAYQHQLDSLVEHRELDIKTDIAVIEKMLKFDGLTGKSLKI